MPISTRSSSILHQFHHPHSLHTSLKSLQTLTKPQSHPKRPQTPHPTKKPRSKPPRRKNDVASSPPQIYARDTIRTISNLLRSSPWDSAKQHLQTLVIKFDSYTINQVLKTHPPLQKAWLFFNWCSKLKGFKHDQYTYTTMLDMFGEAKRIDSMDFLFKQMQEKGVKIDVVTYTSMMHWISENGDVEGAIEMWRKMRRDGCCPTVVSYTAYMKVLFRHGKCKEATEVYKEMLGVGLVPNCFTYTVLMEHLADTGKYKALLEVFDKMQDAGVPPDKATCNILVHKCSGAGEIHVLNHVLNYMKKASLVLRYSVYVEAVECFRNAGESDFVLKKIHGHITHDSIKEEKVVQLADDDDYFTTDRGLVEMFLRSENLAALESMLSTMTNLEGQLDSKCLAKVIELNCACSCVSGALLAVECCSKMNISLVKPVYLTLIGTLIRENLVDEVTYLIERMAEDGCALGSHQAALLIYRLGYSRKSPAAAKVFHLLPEDCKNSSTFSALIASYVFCGNIDKAFKIHEEMLNKGIPSTVGTYNLILSGLHKVGRAHEADIYMKKRKEMKISMHPQDVIVDERTICNIIFEHGIAD